MLEIIFTLGATFVGAIAAYLTVRYGRVAKLEDRVNALEKRDRAAWLYIRATIDHQYKHGIEPLPLPEELV